MVAEDWDQLAPKVAKPVLIVKEKKTAQNEEVKVEEAMEEDEGKQIFEKAKEQQAEINSTNCSSDEEDEPRRPSATLPHECHEGCNHAKKGKKVQKKAKNVQKATKVAA